MSCDEQMLSDAIIRDYSIRVRLARSAELASAENLLCAKEFLAPSGRQPERSEELDLLARLLVLDKRYAEARNRWKDALNVFGGISCYQDALSCSNAYVVSLQKRRQSVILLTNTFGLILAVLLAFYWIKK
jgi:hypothetical protein